MKAIQDIGLSQVQEVYSGPEGDLWELVMGEQIHIGGFSSSMDLAEKAGIGPGTKGVDFCCCNGAGMRFLVRFRDVGAMMGVDATEKVVERGRRRCEEEGLADWIHFTLADVPRQDGMVTLSAADFESLTKTVTSQLPRLDLGSLALAAACPTEAQMDQAVQAERARYDPSLDGKVGLEEAIHALQVVAGMKELP